MKKRIYISMFLTSLLMTTIHATSVLTVTTTNDSGAGSLRQAILDANSAPELPHVIVFSIGSGVQTIKPVSALPTITASYTLLDGTTQPGWSTNNPVIVINGSLLTPYTYDGLTLSGVNNCVIQGLVVNGDFNNGITITDGGVGSNYNTITQCFIGTNQAGTAASANHNGITISGSTNYLNTNNTIGGTSSAQANLISGNTNYGINIVTNVNSTVIQSNYIGTDITGTTAIPNATGISVIGSLTPVTTEQAEATQILSNIISGNSANGVLLQANTIYTYLYGNFIGTDAAGTATLPNNIGITCQGVYDPSDSTNGLVTEATINNSNVISGNASHGIFLTTNTTESIIYNNFIGTDLTSSINLGNGGYGILIEGTANAPCTNNCIGLQGDNVITFNAGYGIYIDGNAATPDTLNPLLNNSIFNNGGNGIVLTNNGNNLQAAPTIINALLNENGNGITIAATAPSTPASTNYRLDFYINNTNRAGITEGQTFIGSIASVASGATVVDFFSLTTTISSNLWVSATATNLNNPGGQPGDTSPYCSNFQMTTLPTNIPAFMF